jgi:hypothetical protein
MPISRYWLKMEADSLQATFTKTDTLEDEEICKECGGDHSFRPTLEDVKTSIEIIPVLIERLLTREQLEQVGIVA